MTELAIIMPVYNEADAIQTVLQKWIEKMNALEIDYQIHVYNDGSKDQSLNLMQQMAQRFPQIIVHDKKNSGHGPTILQGYREQCEAEWIFQVDSDDELSPDDFEKLWSQRKDYDFLIGRRKNRHVPLVRHWISWVSRLVVRIFYGSLVWDVNCPYRLMRSAIFRKLFETIPDHTFAPNIIISGMVSRMNLRVFQTDIIFRPRQTGEVSIKKFKLLKVALKSLYQTILFRLKHG